MTNLNVRQQSDYRSGGGRCVTPLWALPATPNSSIDEESLGLGSPVGTAAVFVFVGFVVSRGGLLQRDRVTFGPRSGHGTITNELPWGPDREPNVT